MHDDALQDWRTRENFPAMQWVAVQPRECKAIGIQETILIPQFQIIEIDSGRQ